MAETAGETEFDEAPDEDMLEEGAVVAGRYNIVEHLAAGGMGRVYVATQMPLGRKVALKVMHRELCSDTDSVKRFFREAVAVSQLTHPNTITVFDYGETEGNFYIAMEFLDGEPLSDRVAREGPMAPDDAIRIVTQVAKSLSEAHRKGIIHRDLKPENIFLGNVEKDLVKVLDFGIAKILQAENEGTKLTRMGFVCGTPEYMSPEQARGEDLDGRCDLYALGVVLYEILTGEPPFMETTPLATVLKHQNDEVPPLPATIPPALATFIIDRVMAKEAEDRPESAEQFVEELEIAAVQSGVLLETTGSLQAPELRRQLAEAAAEGAHAVPSPATTPAPDGPPATEVMRLANESKGSKVLLGVLAGAAALTLVVVAGLLLIDTDPTEEQAEAASKPETSARPAAIGPAEPAIPEPIDSSGLDEAVEAATPVQEVRVSTTPADAAVYDPDGRDLRNADTGKAHVLFTDPDIDAISVTVAKEGYLTRTDTVTRPDPDDDFASVHTVELTPIPTFVLDTDPPGAEVVRQLDQKAFGTTPASIQYRPNEDLVLTISLDGYQTLEHEISGADELDDVTIALKRDRKSRRDKDGKRSGGDRDRAGDEDSGDAGKDVVVKKTDEPKDPPPSNDEPKGDTGYKPFPH